MVSHWILSHHRLRRWLDRSPIADASRICMKGVGAVYHAATFTSPMLSLTECTRVCRNRYSWNLDLAFQAIASVATFVFTSTTSVFGDALRLPGTPAVWVIEGGNPDSQNIYGVTRRRQNLCYLFFSMGNWVLNCVNSSGCSEEDDDRFNFPVCQRPQCENQRRFLFERVSIWKMSLVPTS